MLKFKVGVNLRGITPQLVLGMAVVDQVFSSRADVPTVVTSANDGAHKIGSLHYSGRAADFRTKHLVPGRATLVSDEIRQILGPTGFDVVLEALGGPNEHIHLEWDPKS